MASYACIECSIFGRFRLATVLRTRPQVRTCDKKKERERQKERRTKKERIRHVEQETKGIIRKRRENGRIEFALFGYLPAREKDLSHLHCNGRKFLAPSYRSESETCRDNKQLDGSNFQVVKRFYLPCVTLSSA